MGYDTQKPEGLLERIITWSTKPGDLVADFYSGSGTTASVAQALGRRFIACDVGRTAIAVTRRRVLTPLDPTVVRPLDISSVRRAARGFWSAQMAEQPGGDDADHVLKLYGAKPVGARCGRRDDVWVWVAPCTTPTGADLVDAAVAHAKAQDDALERVDILSWEWSTGDAAAIRAEARRKFGVELVMRSIPDDAQHTFSRRRRLTFLARPEVSLSLESEDGGMQVRIDALGYPDLTGVPEALCSDEVAWSELIDRWLVDWCHQGEGIIEPWISHLTPSETMPLVSPARPLAPGQKVLIKLTTVLGDDIERVLCLES